MVQQFTTHLTFPLSKQPGDTVEVPTVHGNVEMTIPAGTQTGKTFRLKGEGAHVFVEVHKETNKPC